MVQKKGEFNSVLVAAIIILIVIFAFSRVIIPPLMRIIAPLLGISSTPQQPGAQTALSSVHQQLEYLMKYCGVAEKNLQACRCNASLTGLGNTKIFLYGLGTAFADYYEFTSQEEYPVMKQDGQVDLPNFGDKFSRQKLDGDLCVYYGSGLLLDVPYTAGEQALGIVFFQKGNSIAWTSNIVADAGYDEFPGTVAVMWDRARDKRCIWLPRPKTRLKRFFEAEDLNNPLPDCAATPQRADESIMAFHAFVDSYVSCAKANNPQPGICKKAPLHIDLAFTVALPADMSSSATLVIGGQQTIIAQQELGLASPLCMIVEEAGVLREEYPKGIGLTAGDYSIVNLAPNAVCLYQGDVTKLKQFGIDAAQTGLPFVNFQLNFNSGISDEQYKSFALNAASSSIRTLEDYYDKTVLDEAKKQDVSYFLIKAIIQQESHWDQSIVGYKLAKVNGTFVHVDANGNPIADSELLAKGVPQSYGIMQITQDTATRIGCLSTFRTDSTVNIACGVTLLKQLMHGVQERKQDSLQIIAAYNAGENALVPSSLCPNLTQWQCDKNVNYEQTRDYVNKVLGNLNKLLQQVSHVQQLGVA